MNVSRRWLEALLGRPLDSAALVEQFAMLGAPVDAVEPLGRDLSDVIVATVRHVARHPNADRLTVCRVATGADEREVVCGAPNVQAERKYPFAPAGATLPGGVKLERRTIRGVVSNGMLCSAQELGLGADQDGLLELETDAAPGTPLIEALGLDDERLVLDVAANRSDLQGVRGVARELGAVIGATVKLPPVPGAPRATLPPARRVTEGQAVVDGVRVVVEDVEGAPRYMLAVVRGVRVGPSPPWLQQRLRAIGQRPINSVVDASNYVLFEMNQPTHAFDLANLSGPAVVVRRARAGERITTLDGVARTLDPEMTAICDAERPTIVAGVMGSADSEVGPATTDLVLECAAFDPRRTRRTRRMLGLSTESSYRFERGIDVAAMPEALHRLVQLLLTVAGGEVREAPVDLWPQPLAQRTIFLRPSRVAQIMGVRVGRADVERYLGAIGCVPLPKETDRIAVQVPSWRHDLVEEIDLVEEVARLRGYDTIPQEHRPYRQGTVPEAPIEALLAEMRSAMVGAGLLEARTLPLVPPGEGPSVAVANPLSAAESHLRRALVPGLVRRVEHNWARRARDVRLFEVGTVFFPGGENGLPREETHLAAVLTGARQPPHWTAPAGPDVDQWDLKGLFEDAVRLAWPRAGVQVAERGWEARAPGGGVALGWAGFLEADAPPWAGSVFGFELTLEARPVATPRYRALPVTPAVERALSLVVPARVTALAVEDVIRAHAGGLLESAVVFDEYRGPGLPDEARGLGFRLVFRHPERTLRDVEADRGVEQALAALEAKLGVKRR